MQRRSTDRLNAAAPENIQPLTMTENFCSGGERPRRLIPAFAVGLLFMMVATTAMSQCKPHTSYETPAGSRTYILPDSEFRENEDCFDEVMRAIPPNSTIRLSEGTFRTRGMWNIYGPSENGGFHARSGWTIEGQGPGRTTLTYISSTGTGFNYLIGSQRAFLISPQSKYDYSYRPGTTIRAVDRSKLVHNVTVRNMTLDCVGPSLPLVNPVNPDHSNDLVLGAIALYGNNNVVENIHIRNAYCRMMSGGQTQQELFIVYLSGHPEKEPGRDEFGFPVDPEQLATVTARNLVIDEYQGGYCSAILVGGETRGVVENCRITLRNDVREKIGNGGAQFGLNASGGGTYQVTFRNNRVENASRGVNNDTGPNAALIIRDNEFLNCSVGVALTALNGGSRFEAITNAEGKVVRSFVENNTITLAPRENPAHLRVGIAINPRLSTRPEFNQQWAGAYAVTIRNNTIYNGPNSTGFENWGIQLGVIPSREGEGEFWSFANVVEGNRLYDNRDGQPLFNILSNAPDFRDRNGAPVRNSISKDNPNIRMSRKGFIFKSWKENGPALGSSEFRTSKAINRNESSSPF